MLRILPVKTDEDIEIAKILFSESNSFVRGLLSKYDDFPWAIEYWQTRKEEVSELPGKYSQQRACILIARHKGKPAGCVGLLEESSEASLMTYLYVRDEFRGLGIGKDLVRAITEHAGKKNYKIIQLHTNLLLKAAINLYKSLGFEKISHNKEYPEEIKDLIIHMELKLI